MILIGQYDSPFVRRVGIALNLYDIVYEHRPWSSFGDHAKLAAINPLARVPTLVLPGGEVLMDSGLILDFLDHGQTAARRLVPPPGPRRTEALAITGLALGLAEKLLALFYERRFHEVVSERWQTRVEGQILAALAALETRCSARHGSWFFGEGPGHADIALACALRFGLDVHPELMARSVIPALAAHSASAESLPVFRTVSQPFIAPS
jgi:glutathione S-transferase